MTTAKLKCQPGLTSPWTPATTSACWTSDSWSWFQNLSLGSYGHFQNFSVPSCLVVMSPLGQFIKYLLPCKTFHKSNLKYPSNLRNSTKNWMKVIKTFVIKQAVRCKSQMLYLRTTCFVQVWGLFPGYPGKKTYFAALGRCWIDFLHQSSLRIMFVCL